MPAPRPPSPSIDGALPDNPTLVAAAELGPPFRARDHASDGRRHVLVAASGSVAAIKLPEIVHALSCQHGSNISIRIIVTAAARRFLSGRSEEQPSLEAIRAYCNVDGIYVDEDEWRTPWTRGASILHIELRRWAHCLLIAPLSANTLAKIAMGICDNLLLSVVRAWDVRRDAALGVPAPRIFVAPAMNTCMWEHPLTAKHLAVLEQDWGCDEGGGEQGQRQEAVPRGWFTVIRPTQKTLACGDVGVGAMEDWRRIVEMVTAYLEGLP
ncbi:hypothetical protein KEM52_000954 [Ascosphaera acerosa]|nr:hypothetical protein KEM52_000954 [Ascosphaera acerosa]